MSATISQVEPSFGVLLTDIQKDLLIEYKVDQIRENYRYLTDHPEIKKFINMLLKAVLFEQPHKVRQFLYEYIQDNFNEIKTLLEPESMSVETGDPQHSIYMMKKWRNKYKLRHSFKVPCFASVDDSAISTGNTTSAITKIIGDFGFYDAQSKKILEERLFKNRARQDCASTRYHKSKRDQTRPRFLSETKSINEYAAGFRSVPKEVQPIELSKITNDSNGHSRSTLSYTKSCLAPQQNFKYIRHELSMFSQNYNGRTRTPSDICLSRLSGIAVKKNIPDFGFYGDQMKRKAEEKILRDEYIERMRAMRENY